ncbi:MAG: hypothetical protein HY653_02510 [Acidobacteria bacterium]|nr:hypothetical protein [Acidobacteriota bacterium]
MPRNISATAQDYEGPIYWSVKVTLASGAVHYFSEDSFTFLASAYKPNLRLASAVSFSRSLVVDAATIEFLNADLAVSDLLKSNAFEGAECVLSQLLVGVDEAIEVLRGRLHEQEEMEDAVRFRLVSDLDPGSRSALARHYEPVCTWRFGKPPCGYDRATSTFTNYLATRTANIFSLTTIGDSTLAMTVDEHKDRIVVILDGAGKSQKRVIQSNTATTLTLRGRWATKPTSTSKFAVYTFSAGAQKIIFSTTGGGLEAAPDIFSARTIGHTTLIHTVDEHKGDYVRITAGTGSGQVRKIGSNSDTTITLDASEADFSPVPDATSLHAVFYGSCPKDYSPACEDRARSFAFNAFPTLQRELARAFFPFGEPTPGPGGGGLGGDGGGRPGGGPSGGPGGGRELL